MTDTFQLGTPRKPTPTGTKPKTILRTKSLIHTIIYNGKNLTPKPLNPEIYRMAKERQIGIYENLSWKESSTVVASATAAATATGTGTTEQSGTRSILRFKTDILDATVVGSIYYGGSFDIFQPILSSEIESEQSEELLKSSEEVKQISQSDFQKMGKAPTHVSLVLSETNTTFILDIPSCTEIKDSEEGNEVEKQNDEYIYLTEGKGRNRKVVNAEAQTAKIFKKSRKTEPEMIKKKNTKTFASNWEMYDTYHGTAQIDSEALSSSDSDGDIKTIASEALSVDSLRMAVDEKQLYKIVKSPRFQEAVCILERLLSNNIYNEQQKRFRGLSDPDIFREDIQYKYRLKLLWTFSNTTTKGRCVTAIEWNPENHDLVAVGYGKFYFTENTTGMVMIWNMKNPDQPERTWNFEAPVTTLSFSKQDPNLLAIGFYDGLINIIDISKRDPYIVGQNVPLFEAVWCVLWRANPDHPQQEEQICASFDDGKIIFYSLSSSKEMQSQQMMRVAKADGKLKGYNSMRKCTSLTIPVSRYAGARFIRWHPSDPTIYLVGTNEGVVHKCSTNYLNQHLDLFLAHDGPINDLQYSPFSKKIYVTCGDDWHLRVWVEGVAEPLHELFVSMWSVQAMAWSPTHSTILATIYGKTILLWDFQRKVWKPQSETQSPTGTRNTVVQFTQSGRCLVVGDIDGNVHVFALEDMPFPAFFQENLLFDSLERSLTTKLDVMEKIKRIHKNLLLQQQNE